MEDFVHIIEEIEEERKHLLDIIREVERGNRWALGKLDPLIFNEHNKRLFQLNASLMKGKTRYSGEPNYIHPASAAVVLYMLANKFKTLDHKQINKAIGYLLCHDTLEDAIHYDKDKFRRLVQQHPEFKDELESMVLFSKPLSKHFEKTIGLEGRKIATALQVREYGGIVHAYVFVADKIDYSTDLKFLKNDGWSKETRIAKWFIAYPLFVAEEFKDIAPELVEPIEQITEYTRNKYGIDEEEIRLKLSLFQKIKREEEKAIISACKKHLKEFGLNPLYLKLIKIFKLS